MDCQPVKMKLIQIIIVIVKITIFSRQIHVISSPQQIGQKLIVPRVTSSAM